MTRRLAEAFAFVACAALGAFWATRHGFDSRLAFVFGVAITGCATCAYFLRVPRRIALAAGVLAAAGVGLLVAATHERLRGERPFTGPAVSSAPYRVPRPPPPPPPDRPFVFIAWGDARGGASVFERERDAIRAERPAFSIGLGD